MQFIQSRSSRIYGEKNRLLAREAALQKGALGVNLAALGAMAFWWTWVLHPHTDPGMNSLILAFISLAALSSAVLLSICYFRSQWTKLDRYSSRDAVTEAHNRLYFEQLLDEELRRAGRYHYPLTVCVMDIDDFESFNKNFGQERGDELLLQFARFASGNIRFSDCFARYEKDAFVILLPHTDVIRGQKFLSRMLIQVTERLDCTFCGGLTAYQSGETRAEFMMRAMEALEQARREGKKQIRAIVGNQDASTILTL